MRWGRRWLGEAHFTLKRSICCVPSAPSVPPRVLKHGLFYFPRGKEKTKTKTEMRLVFGVMAHPPNFLVCAGMEVGAQTNPCTFHSGTLREHCRSAAGEPLPSPPPHPPTSSRTLRVRAGGSYLGVRVPRGLPARRLQVLGCCALGYAGLWLEHLGHGWRRRSRERAWRAAPRRSRTPATPGRPACVCAPRRPAEVPKSPPRRCPAHARGPADARLSSPQCGRP